MLKKSACWVILSGILEGVPLIGPPARTTIYLDWILRRKDRYHVLSAQIAVSFVEGALIPKHKPSLKSACGTPRWRRDIYLFVEIKIFTLNSEVSFAVLADPH